MRPSPDAKVDGTKGARLTEKGARPTEKGAKNGREEVGVEEIAGGKNCCCGSSILYVSINPPSLVISLT